MREAVSFAREIIRKREASKKTKSEKLRRDYEKSIQRDQKELIFYAKAKGLDMKAIWEAAFEKHNTTT